VAAAKARRSVARLRSVAMASSSSPAAGSCAGKGRGRRARGLGFRVLAGPWVFGCAPHPFFEPVSASSGSRSGVGKSVHCWR
jgi:hypothetical protein